MGALSGALIRLFLFVITVFAINHLASPPAFALIKFPFTLIDCGKFKVKIRTIEVLIQRGDSAVFIVALESGGQRVETSITAGSNQDIIDIGEDIDILCDVIGKALDQQPSATANATAPNNIQTFTVGNGPIDATAGDFNGDGLPDLAIANQDSNNVSILLMNAASTALLPPTNFPTGSLPQAIVAGDFNTDGKIDLVTANASFGAGDLSLLLGNGAGAFAAPFSVPAGSSPVSVAAADFNKDGKLDLAVADSAGGNAFVLRGNGNGTFQASVALTVTNAGSILAEDINDDGSVDLLTNGFVLLNDGSGNFPTAANFAAGFQPTIVRTGDLNGDGRVDLVTANKFSNSVTALVGNGDGTFQTPRHYIVGNRPEEIIIGNLNGDGKIDLAVSNILDDHLSILFGHGDGSFTGGRAFPAGSVNGVALANFDGDGLLDLVAGGGNASVLKGQAMGAFGAPLILTGQTGSGVVAGDFNKDGKQDVAFILEGNPRFANDKLQTRLGNGDLTFGAATTITLPDADFALDFTLAIDINKDGNLDLVTANTGTDDVSVFLGNGNGTFQGGLTTTVGDQPKWLAAGDLDGNGTLDLAVVNAGPFGGQGGNISVLLGTGSGSFSTGPSFFLNTEPDSVVIGDVTGDGKADLAAVVQAPLFDWNVQIVPGNGNGTFGSPVLISIAEDGVGNLTASDLDLDGDLDLIMTVFSEIGILENNGNGTFKPLLLFDGGVPGPITAIDLNHDQRPDLVIPQSSGTVAVLLNTAAAPTKVSHDLNGDGLADLVWRDTTTGAVALWLLNGPTIASTGFPGGVPLSWHIAGVGDVNADGKADVIWQNATSGLVAVWLMNGLTVSAVGFPGATPTAWVIAGTGDLNGNGTADIIWRNTSTGEVAFWLMNGTTIASPGFPGRLPLSWQIAEVGDVNADGKTDVIWQNTTSGLVAVWLMNGLTVTSVGFPGSTPNGWVIAGTGDLNGNGTADLVWHNITTGKVALWLMNGATIASAGFPGGVALNWHIAQVGDVNADGRADVIWRNRTSGVVAVWMMNGMSIGSVGFPGTAPTDWEIQ